MIASEMTTNTCFCVLKGFEIIYHSEEVEQLTYRIKNEPKQSNMELSARSMRALIHLAFSLMYLGTVYFCRTF